jgi:hypothetical protein
MLSELSGKSFSARDNLVKVEKSKLATEMS